MSDKARCDCLRKERSDADEDESNEYGRQSGQQNKRETERGKPEGLLLRPESFWRDQNVAFELGARVAARAYERSTA